MKRNLFVIITIIIGGCLLASPIVDAQQNRRVSLFGKEADLKDRLNNHIRILSEDIGERSVWEADQLADAADYIESMFSDSGYRPAAQMFEANGVTVRNIEVEIKGKRYPEDIIVVGAHYDSTRGCPGANDNATGVAAVLEIGRMLSGKEPERTVRMVAFVNEEPPFFKTELMGSRQYAMRSKVRDENVVAMLCLETIGYYSDQPGSQKYPVPLRFFYPGTGNFIAFVSNIKSRQLLRQSVDVFKKYTGFPIESAILPSFISGVDWSDHWAFWKVGYPAILISDTALYRYKYYHTMEDLPDKLALDCMTRVVHGVAWIVADIAGIQTLSIL